MRILVQSRSADCVYYSNRLIAIALWLRLQTRTRVLRIADNKLFRTSPVALYMLRELTGSFMVSSLTAELQ